MDYDEWIELLDDCAAIEYRLGVLREAMIKAADQRYMMLFCSVNEQFEQLQSHLRKVKVDV